MDTNDKAKLLKELNEVKLLVGGTEFGGWKSVRIDAGIDRLSRTFDLEVTNNWPGNTEIVSRIKQGDEVQVMIGGDVVVTGYVDEIPIRYDAKTYTVGIKGRSKTADLVDCCPETDVDQFADVIGPKGTAKRTKKAVTQWHKAKLEKIAEYLVEPYGIKVFTQVDTGDDLIGFALASDETVFEVIDRMVRKRQVLVTDTALGDLMILDAGSGGRCTTALELGRNILTGSAALDYKDVFSKYVCYGSLAGTPETENMENCAEYHSGSLSVVTSKLIGRRRVLVKHLSGQTYPSECSDVAIYERSHREGKALETYYTVSGWREENYTLWQPNKLVRVRDALIGFDVDMLIVGVSWVMDASGQRTELKVGPCNGYLVKGSNDQGKGWSDVH